MKCEICGKELVGVYSDYNFRNRMCSKCYDGNDVLYAERGSMVIVKNITNGLSDDRETAQRYFGVGDLYTVDSLEIGRYSSRLILKEFPNIRFNTVHFELYKKQSKGDR